MTQNYGIKISKPGQDVLTATDVNLFMSSKFPMFKIKLQGTSSVDIYKTSISDGGNGITSGQTTIGVASTSGFPSSANGQPMYFWIENTDTGEFEAVSYTGISGNSFTGCTRGYRFGYPPTSFPEGARVVCGYNEVAIAHSFGYEPVSMVFAEDTTKFQMPIYSTALRKCWVDTTNQYISVDLIGYDSDTSLIPPGTFLRFSFSYSIMLDSITQPYY